MRNTTSKNAESAKALGALPNTDLIDLDVTDDTSVKNAVNTVYARHGKNRCINQQRRDLRQWRFRVLYFTSTAEAVRC